MVQTQSKPPRPTESKTAPLTLHDLPPDVLAQLRNDCQLTDTQIADFLEGMQSGVKSIAEYMGFTPAIANTLEAVALTFYRQGHYVMAANIYGFLLEVDPDRGTAWRGVGACHQAQKSYPLAVWCYEYALESDPNDLVARVLMGESLCLMGRIEYGARVLQQALTQGSSKPYHKVYVERAQAILRAQNIAFTESTANAVAKPPASKTPQRGEALSELFIGGGDNAELFEDPKIQAMLLALTEGVQRERITVKDVAGFTDEQMYGGYVAACRYLDLGQPLLTMQIVGWLLYLDSRNPSYYQLAGLSAQHLGLWCFADYLYGMSLIYDKDKPNPATLIYQGEAKIFSEERHAGLELIRQGLQRAGSDPQFAEITQRGKTLLTQFGDKDERATNRSAP